MMARIRRSSSGADDVRMGPLALFTLISVVCLSVLAVLAISTSNATLALAQRRATATSQLYLDETAAQTFLATLDDSLASGDTPEAALEAAKDAALASVTDEAEGTLAVTTSRDAAKNAYSASFDCGNGRQLNITITPSEDGGYRVEQWRMTTVQNEEPPMGSLLGSSGL